jgi:hypothetical protein
MPEPELQLCTFPNPQLNPENRRRVSFYAASDLVLIRDGLPTLQPAAEDFFLDAPPFNLPKDTRCDPEHTYLRTRQYAPWIAYFNGHGMERHVLARGSVLSFTAEHDVTLAELADLQTKLDDAGRGLYRNEGLGRVLVNPPSPSLNRRWASPSTCKALNGPPGRLLPHPNAHRR